MSDSDCRYMMEALRKQIRDLILQSGYLRAKLRGVETQLDSCIDLHDMAHPKKENEK